VRSGTAFAGKKDTLYLVLSVLFRWGVTAPGGGVVGGGAGTGETAQTGYGEITYAGGGDGKVPLAQESVSRDGARGGPGLRRLEPRLETAGLEKKRTTRRGGGGRGEAGRKGMARGCLGGGGGRESPTRQRRKVLWFRW